MNNLPLLNGLAEVADNYTAFLVDSWGVMHDGVTLSNGNIEISHDPVVKLDEDYSDAMLKAMSTEWATPDDAEYYSTSE